MDTVTVISMGILPIKKSDVIYANLELSFAIRIQVDDDYYYYCYYSFVDDGYIVVDDYSWDKIMAHPSLLAACASAIRWCRESIIRIGKFEGTKKGRLGGCFNIPAFQRKKA